MSAEGKRDNFAQHAAVYAVGNIARKVIGFLMLPIYTRYLAPADYGAVGLLGFALALLEPFFGARLAQAVPKFYFDTNNPDQRRAIITSAITLTGGVSAVSAALIALFSGPSSQLLFGSQQYVFATALFGINMLTQPIEYTGMMYVRLQERSGLFLAISIAKMLAQIALNVLLVVYLNLGVIGVVLSGVIASTVLGVGLTIYVFVHSRPRFDASTTWQMVRYAWPLWFAGLAGLYVGSSCLLYLRVFDSLTSVGLFDLGAKFAGIVALFLWTPFSQHWELVSFRYHAEGRGKETFPPAFMIISALMLISGLGISIFSEPVIQIMSASAFHAAASTVPLLTLGSILNSLVAFFYFSFLVTGHTKLFSYCHYISAIVITGLFLALIPHWGLMGAATGQCLAFTINFVFVRWCAHRYYDSGIRLGALTRLIAVCAGGYVCANLLYHAHDRIADLAYKAAVFIVFAALLALMALREVGRLNPGIYSDIETLAQRFKVGGLIPSLSGPR
jgi:O-antigen/teichoic acid export membrane protein